MVPAWAIIPAATQLIVQSFRHPNTDKVILVDEVARKVSVVPRDSMASEDVRCSEQTSL